MNYSDLTDFEINKLVAEALGYQDISGGTYVSSYCNSPSDAWPIILENKIDIVIDPPVSTAYEDAVDVLSESWSDSMYAESNNPLRAAMIVYLMMNEG